MESSRPLASNERRTRTSRRLFVGIALNGAARAACEAAIDGLRRTGFAAKFEAGDKLHVTLAFLGNVDRARHDEIAALVARTAENYAPFAVTLDKVGAFPHERRPRVVYVGAREQGAAFRALSTELRSECAKLGFSFKDDAVAHVTIARVKDRPRPLPLIEFAPGILHVEALTLFESVFDPQRRTSRYAVSTTAALVANGV
jgi:RNA 2',3'-cyclic 3'-phosphodiesterase